jgi:esterase
MNLNSRILGSSEKKLVILHGFLGSLDNWITIGRKLEQLNLEVHLVDLRNHGKSFHSKDFSYDHMCFDLKKYLDSKNIKKTSILGHSMGGKVVFSFLEDHENYLDKTIIADILPVEYKNSYDNIFQSLKSINPRTLTKRVDFEEHLKNYFDDELFISFLSKNLTRDENGNFKFKFNLITLSEKFDEVLKALKPTRLIEKEINLIYGSKSDYITEIKLNDTLQYFSNIKLSVIENAGHWLHYEKQDDFINHCKKIISI